MPSKIRISLDSKFIGDVCKTDRPVDDQGGKKKAEYRKADS